MGQRRPPDHNGQPPPQPPPTRAAEIPVVKTTTINTASCDVIPQPGGVRMLVFTLPTNERIVVPLNAEAAEQIGKALSAPSVQLPGGGVG